MANTYKLTRYSSSIFSLKFFADSASTFTRQATLHDRSSLISNWHINHKLRTTEKKVKRIKATICKAVSINSVVCKIQLKNIGKRYRCSLHTQNFQFCHHEEPPPNFLHCSQSLQAYSTSSSSSHMAVESL